MTKEPSNSIKNRSRFKNSYLKWSSRENFLDYIKSKNLCNSLNKKAKKTYFEKATENGIMGSKKFWSIGKPFLLSKGFVHNSDITIEIDNKTIEDKSELAKIHNSHYINMVKSTTGKHPTKLGTLASRISKKRNCYNYHWQMQKSSKHYKYQKQISTNCRRSKGCYIRPDK